ncbi:unnamed protein product [Pleuronectes platessa]|uniref:Uncharacterized protein n=1 Tax=Pleuronectes platessa TaxID=8262 RepID=A0A9N7Y7H2_PLEPL|nr:unnamed protein product [Pleuronectes platessa]
MVPLSSRDAARLRRAKKNQSVKEESWEPSGLSGDFKRLHGGGGGGGEGGGGGGGGGGGASRPQVRAPENKTTYAPDGHN